MRTGQSGTRGMAGTCFCINQLFSQLSCIHTRKVGKEQLSVSFIIPICRIDALRVYSIGIMLAIFTPQLGLESIISYS